MDASNEETLGETAQVASVDRKGKRSRSVMVCQECKRLKLQCDRAKPCQQCVKRNTVDLCIYSPGASGKQDIYTVSSRVTDLENFMTSSTNGHFQPSCPSTNQPPSQTGSTISPNFASQPYLQHPHPHSHHHHHHHHTAVVRRDPHFGAISRSFEPIIPACLEDLQIFRDQISPFQENDKPGSSFPNNFERGSDTSMNSISQPRTSKVELRQRLREYREEVDNRMPSIALYLPVHFESQSPPNNSFPVAILSLLPPLSTCQLLLQSAEAAFFLRRLPFDPSYGSEQVWKQFQKRSLEFISNGRNENNGTMYSGGPSQPFVNESILLDVDSRTDHHSQWNSAHGSSLTFFAMTCVTLAIGAIHAPIKDEGSLPKYTAEFLYALSQQALEVWDTRNSSSSSKRSTSKGDTEHMEYLFACLLGIVYLLQSGTVVAASPDEPTDCDEDVENDENDETKDLEVVTTLVGKIVSCAHKIRLGEESTWRKKKKRKSSDKDHSYDEWKRMIWWEIVFYDLFLADVLGQEPRISLHPHSTNFPSCALFTKSEGDQPEDDVLNRNPQISNDNQAAKTRMELEMAYLGARYQLARVAHAVKSRRSQPDCCCGYTLDHAVALENQVLEWQNALPSFLKVSSGGVPSLFTGSHHDYALLQMWAHELTIVSNVLVANLYMPFLCPDNSSDTNRPRFKNIPATLACTHAAQAVVHLVKGLQEIPAFSPGSSSPKVMLPTIFDFLPLQRLLFDSVVICGHSTFQGVSPSMPYSSDAIADATSLGVELLADFKSKSLGFSVMRSGICCDDDSTFHRGVAGKLHARLFQRLRDKLGKGGVAANASHALPGNNQPVGGADHSMHYQQVQVVVPQDSPPTHHTFSFASPSSTTIESDHPTTRSVPSSQKTVIRSKPKKPALDDSEKGKKYNIRPRGKESDRPSPLAISKADTAKFRRKLQAMGQMPLSLPPPPLPDSMHSMSLSPIDASSFGAAAAEQHNTNRALSPSIGHVLGRQVEALQFEPMRTNEMGMRPRKRPALQDIREYPLSQSTSPFIQPNFNLPQQAQDPNNYEQLMSPTAAFEDHTAGSTAYGLASMADERSYMNVDVNNLPEHAAAVVASATNLPLTTPSFSYGNTYIERPPSSGLHALASVVNDMSPRPAMDTLSSSHPSSLGSTSSPVYEHHHHQHHQQHHQHQAPTQHHLFSPHHLQNPHHLHPSHHHHYMQIPGEQGQPSVVGLYDPSTVTGMPGW